MISGLGTGPSDWLDQTLKTSSTATSTRTMLLQLFARTSEAPLFEPIDFLLEEAALGSIG